MKTPHRFKTPEPEQIRDDLVDALRARGYRARRLSQLTGHKEFRSPSRRAGNPLVAMRHAVFVDDAGGVRALREGAPIGYMIELPQRMVDALFGFFR